MFEFIKLIILINTTTLNDAPLDIEPTSAYQLVLSEPIEALNGGAMIAIDINDMLISKDIDRSVAEGWVRENIQKDSVKITLVREESIENVVLTFSGEVVFLSNAVWLTFPLAEPNQFMDSDWVSVSFSSVKIESDTLLSGVNIIWRNGKL